jgi:dihydrolipoamide dehydrogenase
MKGSSPFAADGKAVMVGETEGFAKVMADAATNVVLRVHLTGPSVSGLMAESAVAITLWATTRQIGASTHPHPTFSKVLGEAAMAVDGQQINA